MSERTKKFLMEDCGISESEISIMSKYEILETILEYEGFNDYTDWIIDVIQDVYGVSLEN